MGLAKRYPFKRSLVNIVQDRDFQWKQVMWTLQIGLGLSVIFAVVFYTFGHEIYLQLRDPALRHTIDADEFRYRFETALWVGGIMSAVFVAGCAVASVFYSHRAAGAVTHFRRVFSLVSSGEREARVRLRKRDHFQQAAIEFNTMLDAMSPKSGGPTLKPSDEKMPSGFTLVEVLVVSAIMGVLTLAMMELFSHQMQAQKNADIKSTAVQLQLSVQSALSDPATIIQSSVH